MSLVRVMPESDLATVQSVDRALVIVETLMRDDLALSTREIALQTGINRTTAHRLVNALLQRGWLERVADSAAYRLSLKLLVPANLAHEARDVLDAVRPTLEELSILSRETVHVGVLDGFELVHVGKVDSPERVGISSRIGTRAVPHVTSLGKALLAASDPEAVEAYIAHAGRIEGEFVLVDDRSLRDEIAATRERGYSRDDEEDAVGVRCIGAAVRAAGGAPLFAVSLTGPAGSVYAGAGGVVRARVARGSGGVVGAVRVEGEGRIVGVMAIAVPMRSPRVGVRFIAPRFSTRPFVDGNRAR